MVAVLVQIDGYDPVAGAAVTLYAASHDDPAVCGLNGATWWPALAKLPVLRYDLFDGDFGSAITTPSSSLTLQSEPWPNLGRYMLADARLRLWTGNVGDAWGSYTLRFDGRVTGQPKLADGRAEVQFAVDDRWLDTAFLTTYAGTTGIEGPAAMKGQVKPLALGAPRYVPGKLIDPTNSVFQLSSYGSVQSIDTALERLARFGAAVADHASYAALIAATLAPGTWATCKASGLARFGAPPTGQISFLINGDNSGTDGWCRTPGKLIRRLALLSGGAGKIDDTSLNALDSARAYNLSLYLEEQTTAREAIQKLAASVNAVAGVSWTGQLFVVPVGIGSASVTLAADGSAVPPVGPVQQIEVAAPFKKLALTAERAWSVHQLGDIAFTATLVDLGGYAAGTTYREGNIVELPTGERFMYSAVTPTAGNAPPNATYWTALPVAAATDYSAVVGPTRPENNATVGDNLIWDGSAEQGDLSGLGGIGEGVAGTFTRDTSVYRSGTASFKLTKASTGDAVGRGFRAIRVEPGQRYSFGADLYAAAGGGSVYAQLQWSASAPASGVVTAADRASFQGSAPTLAAGVWGEVRDQWTCPAGIYWASLVINNYVGGPLTANFDNAFIKKAPAGTQKTDLVTGIDAPILSANLGYKYDGTITYTATSTGATINVGAGSLRMGSTSVPYSPMSATVSGTGPSSVDFQLYVQEPNPTNVASWGGSKTLTATSTGINVLTDDRNVRIGGVTVVFPASGTGGGGGFGGSGGGGGPIP